MFGKIEIGHALFTRRTMSRWLRPRNRCS